MIFYLQAELKQYFSNQQPLFDQIMSLRGECYREQKGRLTQRIQLGNKFYFIKQHRGIGWKEIIKNMLQLRWPVLGAKDEWQAITSLQSLGVATPSVVGYGQRGKNPATMQSFILMEELTPVVSLEELCGRWPQHAPSFVLKKRLLHKVAEIARTMHHHGINHRDFYICHFLLDQKQFDANQLTLYLIDLHRAQRWSTIPSRWVIKDLAGLYFSSKEIGLTSRDHLRFIARYCDMPWRDVLSSNKKVWQRVKTRGEQLYRDHQ
jgi:heptose I phosphotransferase